MEYEAAGPLLLDVFTPTFWPEWSFSSHQQKFKKTGHRSSTSGEIIKFFGSLILMTRCKLSNRREPWSTSTLSSFLGQPKFGFIMYCLDGTLISVKTSIHKFARQAARTAHTIRPHQLALGTDTATAVPTTGNSTS